MASRTRVRLLALILLGSALPAAGQDSPLKWPVPPPGPPRETVLPPILLTAGDAARELDAGAVPLDARGAGPFAAGHLPGAVPAWSPDEEGAGDLERIRSLLAARGLAGGEPVLLYGPDREAVARLFWQLRWAGCPAVRILAGGVAAWRQAGRPLETGPARRPPVPVRPLERQEAAVTADRVAGAYGEAGVELLDVRDARGWDRWRTPPTFAAGHIPYSLPFDPRLLLPPGDGWPEPAELRRRLAALGPRPGDPVRLDSTFVLYAEDGRDPRLYLGYLLLTLAGLDARVFPGGWNEWRADPGRPIIRVVSAAETASLLGRASLDQDQPRPGLILIDLREPRDFALGHLPGALNLPYHLFAERFERTVDAGWPGADRATAPLVFYCYGVDCVRSRKAGAQASRLGFRHVLWFRGGLREWRDAGLPLPRATAREERAPPASAASRPSP